MLERVSVFVEALVFDGYNWKLALVISHHNLSVLGLRVVQHHHDGVHHALRDVHLYLDRRYIGAADCPVQDKVVQFC